LFNGFVKINEQEIANRGNISLADIDKMLKHLDQLEVLYYAPKSDKPRLTFIIERLDPKHLTLSAEVYHERKKSASQRLQAVKDYITSNTKCRSSMLLDYFGEKEGPRCGTCDVCKKRNEIGLTEIEFDHIVEQLKPLLKDKYLSLPEILPNIKGFSDDKIISALNWLADHDKLKANGEGKFRWP
jgi:ATP-dependent DNA helicase RecQ